jgi:hypothetical protein
METASEALIMAPTYASKIESSFWCCCQIRPVPLCNLLLVDAEGRAEDRTDNDSGIHGADLFDGKAACGEGEWDIVE